MIAASVIMVATSVCMVLHTNRRIHHYIHNVTSVDWGIASPMITAYDAPRDQEGQFELPTANGQNTEVVNSYSTSQSYSTAVGISASVPNTQLMNLADQYYQVYYGDLRVSPLLPLAQANVETPGRADHNITWSALFPSKYVPIEKLETFNVCDVATNPKQYSALMHECSTRDRGALQMSPTYGTGNAMYNNQMSGTEVDKLKTCTVDPMAKVWVSGASTHPGDRFNIRDVLLRLASAHSDALRYCERNNLEIATDAQAVVMLAMHHHRSGVWVSKGGAGGWRSMQLAYEYAQAISSQEQVNTLVAYYHEHPKLLTIDARTAASLRMVDYTQYTTSSLEANYPVKVLYSYIALQQLYYGGN